MDNEDGVERKTQVAVERHRQKGPGSLTNQEGMGH